MASFLIFREGYSEGVSGVVPPQKEKNLAQDAWLLSCWGVLIGWEMTKWKKCQQSADSGPWLSCLSSVLYTQAEKWSWLNHRFFFWRNMTVHCSVSSITPPRSSNRLYPRQKTDRVVFRMWSLGSISSCPKTQFLAMILFWFQYDSRSFLWNDLEW